MLDGWSLVLVMRDPHQPSYGQAGAKLLACSGTATLTGTPSILAAFSGANASPTFSSHVQSSATSQVKR